MTNTFMTLMQKVQDTQNAYEAAKKELAEALLAGNPSESMKPTKGPRQALLNGSTAKKQPAPTGPAKPAGAPISERVAALLKTGPRTFTQLWEKLGAENKKAIRSHLDKRTAAKVYARNPVDDTYGITQPKAKKPAPARSVKKAPAKKSAPAPVVAPLIVKADKAETTKPSPAQAEKGQTEMKIA